MAGSKFDPLESRPKALQALMCEDSFFRRRFWPRRGPDAIRQILWGPRKSIPQPKLESEKTEHRPSPSLERPLSHGIPGDRAGH